MKLGFAGLRRGPRRLAVGLFAMALVAAACGSSSHSSSSNTSAHDTAGIVTADLGSRVRPARRAGEHRRRAAP